MHSDLPVLLVSTASVPLLPNSLRIQGSDPYRAPSPYTLYTTLLRAPVTMVTYPSSNSASLGIGFVIVHRFVGLPTHDLVLAFHATSLLSLMLQPGSRYFIVTAPFLGAVSGMPQTRRGAMHLTASY